MTEIVPPVPVTHAAAAAFLSSPLLRKRDSKLLEECFGTLRILFPGRGIFVFPKIRRRRVS